MRNTHHDIHIDLIEAQELAYKPSNVVCQNMQKEKESTEYGACVFEVNGLHVKFRSAKITPTKTGLFVTLWKRIGKGPIMPYDLADPIDLFVISTRNDEHFGQFIFPKDVLAKEGVLSIDGEGGKRAMRIYPPWDESLNKQAKKTQEWQQPYFLNIFE